MFQNVKKGKLFVMLASVIASVMIVLNLLETSYVIQAIKNRVEQLNANRYVDIAKGYSETLWGRRRYVPEINAKNFNIRQGAERIAMNAPIQGSAADIIKIAMVNVQKKLDEEGLKTRLILQVHDELVLEAPNDEVEKAKEILVNEMQNVAQLKVPLIAEVEVGSNWYEAH